ncbi:hypothetical protein BV898_11480 [Hypsibius exemplaris]|uniref:Uncharacterized protein n=1 Tax=Hypsibius exemplaris TaxID=2072580 RepID=A0A1W0WGQ6_HYPEX|nr:hypothetical protein BV898_11480 [Hypsibius exemplaris]
MANLASVFKSKKAKEWYEKRNCTYYDYGEEPMDAYILGFTLRVVQGVCAGAAGEGGWLCELKHANHKDTTLYCKKNRIAPDKLPVKNRNLQNDGVSYCFGPAKFYERKDGSVVKTTPEASAYIWVQARLSNVVPLETYDGPDTFNVLEVIRSKLEEDSMSEAFINFLLVCGHTTILNLHYKDMLKLFSHVPALVATGP